VPADARVGYVLREAGCELLLLVRECAEIREGGGSPSVERVPPPDGRAETPVAGSLDGEWSLLQCYDDLDERPVRL
jgi:hypothetical protein